MNSLETETELFRRLKLKLGINRVCANNPRGQYIGQIEYTFARQADKEFLASVIEEMEHEGLLKRVKGRNGATLLVHCTRGVPTYQDFSPDAVQEAAK